MSGVVRIQGLVRIAQDLRARIGRGMTGEEKDAARRNAERALAEVDRILASGGAGAEHLPAPSRKAYEFIRGIQWDRISGIVEEQTGTPRAAAGTVRWPGWTVHLDRLALRLSARPAGAELESVAAVISRMSGLMEGTIRREGFSPDQLTPATRDLRAWFAFLAAPDNLQQYLAAVARAESALRQASPDAGKLCIELRPTRHIYKLVRYLDGRRVILPTAMVSFDSAQFTRLAALVWRTDRSAKRRVEEDMRSEAYQDLVEELEGLAGVVEITRGAVHDLVQSFDRVNAGYFAGAMPRPRLNWSRGFTSRKFGHFAHVSDCVMLSSTLDQPHVPAFVVDFVMYHELLHKKHGVRWRNGRGHAHTPEFSADEQRFAQYAEAEEFLKRLARE